jgi:hypothetical protein
MAFELLLETGSISNDGAILAINDASVWADSTEGARTSYGVFLEGVYKLSATPAPVVTAPEEPLTDVTWNATMIGDGRYTFTAYAFLTQVVADFNVPTEGDLSVSASGGLQQWVSAAWVAVNLVDHLNDAVYVGVLEVPYLAYAYAYKNVLNLDYIKQVKGDIAGGAEQNKLYYKRTDLDYFNALIDGAGYNFALGLYTNYYEIVINLNDIRLNQQIS